MAWPDSMILGILGRRTDEEALVRAVDLAERWSADLRVITGYRPPMGMFPHIVTEAEMRRTRDVARSTVARRIRHALGDRTSAVRGTAIEVVPQNQLERRLVRSSREADILVIITSPATMTFVARRQRSRAERVGQAASCPASVGAGLPV